MPKAVIGVVGVCLVGGVLFTMLSQRADASHGRWVSIGPAPLVIPDQAASVNSGRVSSIAVDPRDPGRWLVGVGNGGVWETRDAGASWTPLTDSAPTLAIGAVAFAPSNPNVIYVGTGESGGGDNTFLRAGLGLLKSTDNGASWELLAADRFARASVKRIRVHPTNADVLLAITTRGGQGRDATHDPTSPAPFGVLKSNDGGVSWVRTLAGQATALEIDPANFMNQYTAIADQRPGVLSSANSATNGVYRSTDGGDTWRLISGPWGSNESARTSAVGRIELAIAPSNPNVLYASIALPPNGGTNALGLKGLYRTDNAWADTPTWIEVPTAATGEGGFCGPAKCNYSHIISVDPSDPDTLFAGGGERSGGVFRCSSCGASPRWEAVSARNSRGIHPDHHAMAWVGNRLIDGNDGGVWSTVDRGSSWQNHNAGLITAKFYGAALHPTNPTVILAGLRDFSLTVRTAGNRWGVLPQAPAGEWGEAEVAISSSRPDTDWMASWLRGTIQRTLDGGRTATLANRGIDPVGGAWMAPVRKCPTDDNVFLTGTNRMWRTNDFFNSAAPTWVANSPAHPYQFPNALLAPGAIQEIAYAPSEPRCHTYAYGNRGGDLWLTRDGGATWTDLDPRREVPARAVNGIAFDPTNPDIVYVALSSFNDATPGTPGHVFKTTNATSSSPSWTDISPPIDVPFNVLAIDSRNPRLVYAGSDTGLWHSENGGDSWIRDGLDLGLPPAPVHDIKINPATDMTVVFTYGRGAYRLVSP